MRVVTRGDSTWSVDEPHVGGYQYWDVWESGEWEPFTLDVVSEFARPGTTVVDIGAWLGSVTLWAADCGAHVVAVEPDQLALEYLYRHIEANDANVDVFDGCISDHTGTCYIQPDITGWGSSMTRVMSEGDEVACLTMPDLFDIFDIERCSLVKMDCEGAECLILEHAAPFLAELGIPMLIALHEQWWSRPVDPSWLDGYNVTGNFYGFEQILALPK